MVVYLDDVGELSTKLGRDTKSRDINNDLTIKKKRPENSVRLTTKRKCSDDRNGRRKQRTLAQVIPGKDARLRRQPFVLLMHFLLCFPKHPLLYTFIHKYND